MVRLNKIVRAHLRGGQGFTPEMALKRALMNCLLWENQFYEDGVAIAERIKALVPQVEPARVAALAIEAREVMKLRHAPLLVLREMARHEHRVLVADTLARHPAPRRDDGAACDLRADALGPAAAQASARFGAGQEGPCARGDQVRRLSACEVRPRRRGAYQDVLFLVHAKPKDADQEKVWKQLSTANWLLPTPGRFRSRPARTSATSERLIAENRLGGLALLRNLRLMEGGGAAQDHCGCPRGDADGPHPSLPLHHGARYAPDLSPSSNRDAEVDQGLCAASGPHAAADRRVGIDVLSAFGAIGDDPRRSSLRSGDPRPRGLRGGDLHVQQ